MSSFVDENDNVEVFACTRVFLDDNEYVNLINCNSLTEEMAIKVEIVQERCNIPIILPNPGINVEEYKFFRKSLVTIKRNQYESEAKDNFIVQLLFSPKYQM